MPEAIATAWPPWIAVTAGVIAVVFLRLFRKEIADLIRRITNIGRTGIAAAPQTQDQKAEAPVADPRTAADQLLANLDNQYIRHREDSFRTFLEGRGLRDDRPETMRVLIRYVVAFATSAEFERIYGLIWGSQVSILQHLNPLAEGAPRDALLPYYSAVAQRDPNNLAYYPFDRFIGFLVEQGLVEQQGQTCRITPRGRTFLTYLTSAGKPPRPW